MIDRFFDFVFGFAYRLSVFLTSSRFVYAGSRFRTSSPCLVSRSR
jgi:hypothetical protein